MKSVKGKLLKKLKTIKTIGYLKPERILHVNAADGFIETMFANSSNKVEETNLVSEKEVMQMEKQSSVSAEEPEVIDVSELMKDLEEDDESDIDFDDVDNKENFQPKICQVADKNPVNRNSNSFGGTPLSEIDISSFRSPDLNSGEKNQDPNAEPPLKSIKLEEIDDPLLDCKKICPPGGTDSVILYTTGLRSVRKTFEDCSSIRFLLESFKVLYQERDLSMHLDFRDELWWILGEKVVPPRLFIKGRYIGGAEEVLRLHEQGKFRSLLAGIPVSKCDGRCDGCAGARFVVCFRCSGSRKVSSGGWLPEKCTECNENGLIICPFCR